MKISKEKLRAARIKAAMKTGFGIPLALIFALFVAVYLDITYTDKQNYLVAAGVCLTFFVLCVWMIYSGVKQKRLVNACERYAPVIARNSVTGMEQLSGCLGLRTDMVRTNLNKMLSLGYLQNIYIDHVRDTIIVQTPEEYLSYQPTITVECMACGGKTTLAVGHNGVCDYCGSPIIGR